METLVLSAGNITYGNNMERRTAVLTEFFTKEKKKLVNYVRKLLKDAGERDAEDVVQDVMLSIYENLDIAAPVGNLASYVYRSIKNRIIDQYRKKDKNPVHFEDVIDVMSGNTLADILADAKYDTHNEVERKEIKEKIFKVVDRLKPEYKAVWIATEIEEYTFDDLSLLWQKPIGTLLAQKHRAVLILRKELEGWK